MDVSEAVFLIEKLFHDNLESSLSDIQELVLQESLNGNSYQEIADRSGYEHDYIKQTGAKLWRYLSQILQKKVTKSNIKSILRQYQQEQNIKLAQITVSAQLKEDWGDAIDPSDFWGRESESISCRNWIERDRCRLLVILGMGGVGKTAFASKLARDIASEFDFVIWRSLRNAPHFEELMGELISFISACEEINFGNSTDELLDCLLYYLSSAKCLIVLDNAESILRGGDTRGRYKAGYENYGRLLRRLADEPHQSSVILTSREQPIGIGTREGTKVRSLQLSGLSTAAAQKMLAAKAIELPPQSIEQYRGNPLALQIAATTIKYVFNGNVAEFVGEGIMVFGDIWDLLERQFQRLSLQEQAIMYWLAIDREATNISQLKQELVPRISSRQLLEVLESLSKRSLIERTATGFTQQPVVMEYMTEKLIDILATEITTGNLNLLQTHPIVKAEDKDYLREAQICLILQPIITKIKLQLPETRAIVSRLKQYIKILRGRDFAVSGYAGGNILNLLKHLQIDLTGWDFSQLQIWQADLRGVNLKGVDFTRADLSKSVFSTQMGSTFAVDFNLNDRLLAIGDDHRIKIWQMPEGKHLMTLPGHDAPPIWTLAFSPTSPKILASGSSDRTVRLWDIDREESLGVLQGHQGSILALVFSPDGKVLASGDEAGKIKFWQVSTHQAIANLEAEKLVRSLVFSPSGNMLAGGIEGKGIIIWDAISYEIKDIIPCQNSINIPLAFSPDSQFLATSVNPGEIKLWHLGDRTWHYSFLGHQGLIEDLCFSNDGKILISSSIDSTIRVWQIAQSKCLRVMGGGRGRIPAIALTADNKTLASVSEGNNDLRLWDLHRGKCLRLFPGYSDRIWSIAFHPDEKILASASERGVARLWNIETGNYRELEHLSKVKSVAISPDGRLLVSVSYNYQLQIWDLTSDRCIATAEVAHNFSWSVAFSPDSQKIITSSGDGQLRCWDAIKGELINTIAAHQNIVLGTVFIDNLTVASTSADKTVKLWNLATGKCDRTLQHDSVVWSVAFNSHTKILATGGEDGKVRLWHSVTGEHLTTFSGHTQLVVCLNFSRDGRLLASGGNDRTIQIWDTTTNDCLQTISAHEDSVFGVAFSPSTTGEGGIFASGSHDETIKLWHLKTKKCLKVFQAPKIYQDMNIQDVTGLTSAQKNMLHGLGSIARSQLQ